MAATIAATPAIRVPTAIAGCSHQDFRDMKRVSIRKQENTLRAAQTKCVPCPVAHHRRLHLMTLQAFAEVAGLRCKQQEQNNERTTPATKNKVSVKGVTGGASHPDFRDVESIHQERSGSNYNVEV